MKEIIKPFSLEEYNKGGYNVETRNGLKTRIICSDQRGSRYPIIALIFDFFEEKECIYCYTIEGKCSIEDKGGYLDLLLSKFEFEDGDIVIRENTLPGSFILPYRGTNKSGGILTEFYFDYIAGILHTPNTIDRGCGKTKEYRLASEDEKQRFFKALKADGKYWNSEKKRIENIQCKYELKPFDKVLGRDNDNDFWDIDVFKYKVEDGLDYPYRCFTDNFTQCIPYNEETKCLLCTKEAVPEKYKTW